MPIEAAGSPLLSSELAATLLQGVITTGLASLCAHLFTRYRRPWFGWFAIAWGIYVTRLLCITAFVLTDNRVWLYWHQVATGWTALALLWSSIVFLRQPRPRLWYLLVALVPPMWSYFAIYEIRSFILAAGSTVVVLSAATLWTGWVFWRHHKAISSIGARLLAISFWLWGLHHLDYPFLRGQGAWSPWGYYLDICFELLVGAGLVLLVFDDLGRGVRALSALSGDLQRREFSGDPLNALLARPLTLAGVSGSAMYVLDDDGSDVEASSTGLNQVRKSNGSGRFVAAAGSCSEWQGSVPAGEVANLLSRMRSTRRPQVTVRSGAHPFVAALPVGRGNRLFGALVMTGDVRNPFTALDDDFLLALGQQVGAALDQADLDHQLETRTAALEQLSARMIHQHEDERRRLSRELHDETAQVFSAVKMQLEGLRPVLPVTATSRLDRLLSLVDTGIRSIRNVTNDLRPSLLDDLGLLPALRSLVSDFSERSGLRATLHAPPVLPTLANDADLALFRALQEALSNVTRHADAKEVEVAVQVIDGRLRMTIRDDGHGFPTNLDGRVREPQGRMGLTGMRERIHGVGGNVTVTNGTRGAEVRVSLPLAAQEVA